MFVAFSSLSTTLWSQQEVNYSLYRHHFNLINPAVTGSEGSPFVNISIRSQWIGVKEAPMTQGISFGKPFKKKNIGVGLSVINDKVHIITQTQFFVDFSYRLPAGENSLYLGLKVGGTSLKANGTDLKNYQNTTISDPSLINTSLIVPNMGIGIYYKSQKFFFSASIPRLLKTSRLKEDNGQVTAATDNPHTFISSGLNIELSNEWDFKPSFLFSYVNAAPSQFIVDGVLSFDKTFDFGLQYSNAGSFGGTIFFKVNERLNVGYSYLGHGGADKTSIGTHEIVLKGRLGELKRRRRR